MGLLLSQMPTDVHLGKFLLLAALFGCLDPALTIAAALNSKSPFVTPFGFEAEADRAKLSFRVGKSSTLLDPLTFNHALCCQTIPISLPFMVHLQVGGAHIQVLAQLVHFAGRITSAIRIYNKLKNYGNSSWRWCSHRLHLARLLIYVF